MCIIIERVLVTGGAGFIGSHLVDRLVDSHDVVVLDDLSGGDINFIKHHLDEKRITFIKGSILSKTDVRKALDDVTTVFHFAAQPDVRLSATEPMTDFEVNMVGSMTLLEEMRKHDISRIIFASSGGTVYGDSEVFPTPEATPFAPISNYGAAKCAFEMYLSSYAELYGMSAVSLRMANIIGPRLTHGVIYDFYNKLKSNPTRLEVLGTGQQEKAYMYITDTVEAVMILSSKLARGHLPVNVGSGERLTVSKIAELAVKGLGVPDAKIEYTGSDRGWAGDVVITDLDIELLRRFGWQSKLSLEEGVNRYLQWLNETCGSIL